MGQPNLRYPTLYGTRTDEPVAYCYLHKCHLTVTQLKKKECLSKQCPRLRRNEEHPFWAEREAKKEQRRARRERLSGGGQNPICPETTSAGG